MSRNGLAVAVETYALASRQQSALLELAPEPFVLLERAMALGLYDQIIAACQVAGFFPPVAHGPDRMAKVWTLVVAELGVSMVPEGSKNLRSRQGVFVPIVPSLEPIELVMCWTKGKFPSPRGRYATRQ